MMKLFLWSRVVATSEAFVGQYKVNENKVVSGQSRARPRIKCGAGAERVMSSIVDTFIGRSV